MPAVPETAPPRRGPRLPRRDRIAILAALAATTAIAWAYLVLLAVQMQGMDAMGSMSEPGAVAIRAWSAADFGLMFLMWAVMMVGMMVPSAAPMVMMYAAVSRKAESHGNPVAPTACFVAGYVAVWTAFSFLATLAQWGLDRAALLSPMMVTSSPWLGALLLGFAGVYQLTPAKDTCLRHCRAPAHFISEHWRPGPTGAFRMGVVHGAFCLGCCWALMGLLFFGGVMNLLWIAAIAAFVLAEKLLPAGRSTARWSGFAMLAAGGFLAARWWAGS
jgi:predicted metal-binding membrane protein